MADLQFKVSSGWFVSQSGDGILLVVLVVKLQSTTEPAAEAAYLDAVGWVVHDSGLWFLRKAGDSLPCTGGGQKGGGVGRVVRQSPKL